MIQKEIGNLIKPKLDSFIKFQFNRYHTYDRCQQGKYLFSKMNFSEEKQKEIYMRVFL